MLRRFIGAQTNCRISASPEFRIAVIDGMDLGSAVKHQRWRTRWKIHGWFGRRDKANWRSLAPFGRKGLSAHWIVQVFAVSKWRCAKCAGAALRTFPMNFNLVRDGARNVRRGGATLFVRYRARGCDLMRSVLGSSCVSSFRCQSSSHGT